MGAFLVFLAIVAIIVLQVVVKASATSGPLRRYDRLSARGTRGRALVLASSPIVTGVTINGRRFQRRQMTLDVEIDGAQPYEVSDTFLVPRGLVEPIPGCSLDVAVDPSNPNAVAVLGPGGFTGPWLVYGGPPQPY